MVKLSQAIWLAVAFCGLGSGTALAGMGDPSAHIKEQNAICDAQRRGDAPRYPDMCLPELPPYSDYHERSDRR